MNGQALEPVRWSRRRWLGTILFVFAVQAGLVFGLGRRAQSPPVRPGFPTLIQLAADEKSVERLARYPGIDDPLLLAQPGLQGFSGPAWLRFPTLEYQPVESPEPPHWLELKTTDLGAEFVRFVKRSQITPLLVTDKPLPPLIRYEPRFPNDNVRAESSLQIQGELAERALVAPIQLRSWVHSEMLSNTVVQVGVDADGITFSPVLMSESGLRQADLHALHLASAARFQPLSREARRGKAAGMIWGRMVFRWKTIAAPLTNLPAVTP